MLPRDPSGRLPVGAHTSPSQQGVCKVLSPGPQGQDGEQRLQAGGCRGEWRRVEAGSEFKPRLPTQCASDGFQLLS